MLELLAEFYNATSIIDILYLIITILSLIKCFKKGSVSNGIIFYFVILNLTH